MPPSPLLPTAFLLTPPRPECAKFLIIFKRGGVDQVRIGSEKLRSPQRDPEIAASGCIDQSCLFEIGFGPPDPVTCSFEQKAKKPTGFGWLFVLQINDLPEFYVERAMGNKPFPVSPRKYLKNNNQ